MHLRSHTKLPVPLVEGNARADALTLPAILTQSFEHARLSRNFFHQNALALQKEFNLTPQQARDIIRAYADCQRLMLSPLGNGVNVRGLDPNEMAN